MWPIITLVLHASAHCPGGGRAERSICFSTSFHESLFWSIHRRLWLLLNGIEYLVFERPRLLRYLLGRPFHTLAAAVQGFRLLIRTPLTRPQRERPAHDTRS